ncbi:MAG: FkbM family methyltransferase [Bacteroidetes bacterium]|nr:FkbM family methyltransferase [Bacteroidota bacterium]
MLDRIKTLFDFSRKKAKPEKVIRYCGFDLYYSEGTSIVERYLATGTYEQKTLDVLIESMKQTPSGVFVDVGANVGLISLAISERFPSAQIFAFEPGPHQFRLLEKTLEKNNLKGRIYLFPVALSSSNGTAFFHVHQADDASGDGFLDTGRAGKSKKISVVTQTLDDWWTKNGQPKIDLVKCDTEGAELMVLRGGENVIGKCRPHLLLEIFYTNLLNYPYGPSDIFNWLEQKNYSLFTLDKKKVSSTTELEQICKHESEFLALPNV